ncbi:MAG: malic enzyme-like NAD(P)-binding protein [Candidatus Peregrinibacteria bacterium]
MDFNAEALKRHRETKGKLSVSSKMPLVTREDLAVAYTPGVAAPCLEIAKNPEDVYTYCIKGNAVAVVTDGSAVLGLGNIGALASIPVMEGKCALFKRFADIDAFPIALDTQDPDEIVRAVELIAPVFGGINLEDISAPRCIEIERRLQTSLSIPVFHDDQHGTAIVVLAGIINALKVVGKDPAQSSIVISGAGAAGSAVAKLLNHFGVGSIVLTDSKGIIHASRTDLDANKREIAAFTNMTGMAGTLSDALIGADVFIGVSKAGVLKPSMIRTMAKNPIVLAMANPTPEIMPDEAASAGAAIVATGRSDFPNQLNNALIFPGIFRGALDSRASSITTEMKLAAAKALASLVPSPSADKIIPSIFEEGVMLSIAEAVKRLK